MAKITKYHYSLLNEPLEIINLHIGEFEIPNKVIIKQYNNMRIDDIYKSYKLEEYKTSDLIYSPIHFHEDKELRVFLEGSGTFYVYDNNTRIWKIECFPGTVLILEPEIVHWFKKSTNDEMQVIRLYEKNEQHESKDVKIDLLSKAYDYFRE